MLILYKGIFFLSKVSAVLVTILVLVYDASDDASGSVPELSLSTGATVVFNWRHCRFQLAPLWFSTAILQSLSTGATVVSSTTVESDSDASSDASTTVCSHCSTVSSVYYSFKSMITVE